MIDSELLERLDYLARKVALAVYGVHLGVEKNGDRVVFVDSDRDPIADDGDIVICATKEELDAGAAFKTFWQRVGHAATIAKNDQLGLSRAP